MNIKYKMHTKLWGLYKDTIVHAIQYNTICFHDSIILTSFSRNSEASASTNMMHVLLWMGIEPISNYKCHGAKNRAIQNYPAKERDGTC